MNVIFNRKQLLDFFVELDKNLTQAVPLYVIGGAAATVAYKAKSGTKDVDTWEREERIEAAYEKVKATFPIYLGPANVNIRSQEMKRRFKKYELAELKYLSIYVPEPEDLFLLKAQRSDEKDLADLTRLNDGHKLDKRLIFNRFKRDVLELNPANDSQLKFNYLRAVARVFGSTEALKQKKMIDKL